MSSAAAYDANMVRRGTAVALVLVAALGTTGCGGGGIGSGMGGGLPASGPLAVYPRPDAGMDALLEGEVALVDGCVVVTGEEFVALPVFPAGDASWTEGVLTWHGEGYRTGDTIALGGGFSPASVEGAYIPAGCEDLEAFAVSPF